MLEQFNFPSTPIFDPEIKAGNLNAKYDVLVFPTDSTATLTGDQPAGGGRGGRGGGGGREQMPPEYRTGFGNDGVTAIRDFVQKGGTLVALNESTDFAITRLNLGVRNVLAGKSTKEFWCPGSTLRVSYDNTNPIAYGMPANGLALFVDSPAFEITAANNSEDYEVVSRYADRDILESGWLVGEDNLSRRATTVSVKMGQGRVVLIGFRAQHRAQTQGTYKILFNSLIR
jgi:hypothetical protein